MTCCPPVLPPAINLRPYLASLIAVSKTCGLLLNQSMLCCLGSMSPPAWHVANNYRCLISLAHQFKQTLQARLHPPNHGERRLRRAGLTGVVTLLARGIGLGVSLLSLPFASHYLGKERFGLWLVLIGLVNWVSLTDLGLANGLINALSTADGREDRAQAQTVVASAFWVSLTVAAVLLALFFLVNPWLDWPRIFNVASAQARAEVGLAVAVVMCCFVLRMLAGLLSSVYVAYQEGYVYQGWCALCGLLSAAGLLTAIKVQAGVPGLVGGFVGGWLLGELLSALYLFGWHRPWLRPAWRHFDPAQARQLLRSGSQLWVAQVSHVALIQTDLLVVTLLFGAQAVAGYGTVDALVLRAIQSGSCYLRTRRSEERRVGKECRSRWSPYH